MAHLLKKSEKYALQDLFSKHTFCVDTGDLYTRNFIIISFVVAAGFFLFWFDPARRHNGADVPNIVPQTPSI